MSGVYISNFEMPKDGYRQLFLTAEGEIIWYPTSPQNGEIRIRAIPVPDHGRLIDADALCMKLKMMYAKAFGEGNTAYHAAYRSLERVVSHEPTIIPASKEEEL